MATVLLLLTSFEGAFNRGPAKGPWSFKVGGASSLAPGACQPRPGPGPGQSRIADSESRAASGTNWAPSPSRWDSVPARPSRPEVYAAGDGAPNFEAREGPALNRTPPRRAGTPRAPVPRRARPRRSRARNGAPRPLALAAAGSVSSSAFSHRRYAGTRSAGTKMPHSCTTSRPVRAMRTTARSC